MKTLFLLSTLLIFVSAKASLQTGEVYSVILSGSDYQIVPGSNGIATGVYLFTQNTTGWNKLDIKSNPSYNDTQQSFAAGYLEGALTAPQIWQALLSFNEDNANLTSDFMEWVNENYEWVFSQTVKAASLRAVGEDSVELQYWGQVELILSQLNGMLEGYNDYAPAEQQITFSDLLLNNLDAEIGDIQSALGEDFITFDPKMNMYKSHCSSFVRHTDEDLLAGHVTWTDFGGMLRLYKSYNLPYNLNSTKADSVSFSGFFGFLPSGDDWYITSQNMTVAETTNNIMNNSLYDYVHTRSVPYWIRSQVANRMASSGEEWTTIFAMYNSGTYNNQWIIVDYKLYEVGKPLKPNTLWILEQVPGWVISGDETEVLSRQGYWGSYNTPFFEFIYNISGYGQAFLQYGDVYSYTMAPRAQIFNRDAHTVHDISTMKTIMRYNQWQIDPLSLGDACNGISARCDLNAPTPGPAPFGGIDAKVTSAYHIQDMLAFAVCGPTWDDQPPFAWTGMWNYDPHFGEVEVFDFEWVEMSPTAL